MPERAVVDIRGRSVLLVRRFDRSDSGRPFSYLSAGTLLKEPHTAWATQKTYLDIALAARAIGVPAPEREMFRRLLLNSYLHNTDDHLRNHAVIRDGGAWRLSPLFDVVPHPRGKAHVCAPAPRRSPAWDPALAFESHQAFGIPRREAERIRDDVVGAASRFPEFLDMRGAARKDRELLVAALPASLGLRPVA